MNKAKLKNSKPEAGMKLHKFIAVGGNPADYNKANNTDKLRASSKKGSK